MSSRMKIAEKKVERVETKVNMGFEEYQIPPFWGPIYVPIIERFDKKSFLSKFQSLTKYRNVLQLLAITCHHLQ